MSVSTNKELSEIDSLADAVRGLGLEKPVDFLVESHYPLANLMRHMLMLTEPLMSPFLSLSRIRSFSNILNDHTQREQFLQRLRKDS